MAMLTSSVHETDSNPVQELGLELIGRRLEPHHIGPIAVQDREHGRVTYHDHENNLLGTCYSYENKTSNVAIKV